MEGMRFDLLVIKVRLLQSSSFLINLSQTSLKSLHSTKSFPEGNTDLKIYNNWLETNVSEGWGLTINLQMTFLVTWAKTGVSSFLYLSLFSHKIK